MKRVLVTKEPELNQVAEAIANSSVICFDTETNGLNLHGNHQMVGIAFYCDFNKTSYYIPFAHGAGAFEPTTKTQINKVKAQNTNERYKALNLEFTQLEGWVIWDKLKTVLTPDKLYLCHNAQFDLTALYYYGVDLTGAFVYDTMLAARVLYSDFGRSWFNMPDTKKREKGNTRLKWLSRLFGLTSQKNGYTGDEQGLKDGIQALKKSLGKNIINLDIKKHLWSLAPEIVAPYACMDVELTYQLHQVLLNHLETWQQVDVYKQICNHQTNVTWVMHMNGLKIDHKRGLELLEAYEQERDTLTKDITFNYNSNIKLAAYADSCGVKLPLTDKGNPKTDKKTLKAYQKDCPLFRNILEVKKLDKNIGTYIKKWLDNTTPETPIHPSFNVLGTVTGRLSSSDTIAGNLQNIPKDTKLKYSPKKLLLPLDPGYSIVEIDYSQLEMRVGAWVAETLIGAGQDLTLTNLILDGVDMHSYTRDNAKIPEILLMRPHKKINYYQEKRKFYQQYIGEHKWHIKSETGFNTKKLSPNSAISWLKSEKGVNGEKLAIEEAQYLDKIEKQHNPLKMTIPEYMETERGHDLSQYADDNALEAAFMDYARFVAKVPNFAAMYGGGWQALTNILDGITEEQARQIMEGWKLSYPTIVRAMTALTGKAMEWRLPPGAKNNSHYQYIQYPDLCTPFIRKWNYYAEYEKREKSKDAFNSVVQGTAGFITVESIARVLKRFNHNEITPHLTVHDSFIFSIPKSNTGILPDIADIMTDWDIYPPLAVDIEIAPAGCSWGDKKAIEAI